jgi:hypothetical protein
MREIVTEDRRLSAVELCRRLQGMCLLVVATVTADGRPLVGPVDGYLLHGSFYFSSGRSSVKMRHLAARPALSAIQAFEAWLEQADPVGTRIAAERMFTFATEP